VPEGWRTEQIAEELEKQGLNGGAKAFMKAVEGYGNGGFDFLKDRPNRKSLEGYLFPDTYNFKADTPPEDIIQQMLQNFDTKFEESLRERAGEMGLTVNEVLIFASLVEHEAVVARERPVIAGIYISRYENGIRLEADPTVQYIFGKKGDWWPSPLTDVQLHEDNRYNTYQVDGLPPGPIANPGIQSILAVLEPIDTDYVYFVADPSEDGSHNFAVDKVSQDQNVAYLLGEADAPAPCSNPWADGCVLSGT
jgi:peptidoglycan lytic transglycosylase G